LESTGVRRRVALAAALLHRPELLVLDEPTSGMDVIDRRELWVFLGGLVGRGVTVLVTTHQLEEVEGCDRLGLVLEGRLRFAGTPAAMREAFGVPVLRVEADPWADAFRLLKGAYGATLFGRRVHVDMGRATQREVTELLQGARVVVRSIERVPPSLEDAFLRAAEAGADGVQGGGSG
jgi:ABC-2 type transport system ATP-binding protein